MPKTTIYEYGGNLFSKTSADIFGKKRGHFEFLEFEAGYSCRLVVGTAPT